MEIRFGYVYISCVLILSHIEAKSVSLNDLIAAEERTVQRTARKSTLLTSSAGIPKGTPKAITPKGRKTSPLKYQQTYQIASPSKPKKFKFLQKLQHKRNNLNKKRETNHNDGIIQKYIPLLKNIKLLVGNILPTESSELYEHGENKYKRNLIDTNERDDVVCTCARKSTEPTVHTQEEANTFTPTLATEVQKEIITPTIATTTQTFATIDDNIRSIGRYKNVPVLSTRNSTSVWRNDSGFSQRGSAAFNRSTEGNIARNNGNNKHHTREEVGPDTENYEAFTDSYSRNDAGRDRSRERLRRLGIGFRNTELNRETIKEESKVSRNATIEDVTRNLPEYEGKIEHEIRRDKAESSLSISKPDSRSRGFGVQEEGTTRSTEISKNSVTEDSTSYSGFSDRNESITAKNQEFGETNEAIVPKHISPNSTYPVGKVVMIFDGYSVAKDVNGANKLTEKAIQIHT